jgi:hypothetical protein
VRRLEVVRARARPVLRPGLFVVAAFWSWSMRRGLCGAARSASRLTASLLLAAAGPGNAAHADTLLSETFSSGNPVAHTE